MEAAMAGIAQSVRASAFQAEGRGFESRFPLQGNRFKGGKWWQLGGGGYEILAHVAQLAERILGKDEVTSSILVVGSSANLGQSDRNSRIVSS